MPVLPVGAPNEAFWETYLDRADLTLREWEVLVHIAEHVRQKGYPPTIRRLCDIFGCVSGNNIHSLLRKLEAKGRIRSEARCYRAVSVVGIAWEPRRSG